MLKRIIFLCALLIQLGANAQNYADTIQNLPFVLKTNQQAWHQQALVFETAAKEISDKIETLKNEEISINQELNSATGQKKKDLMAKIMKLNEELATEQNNWAIQKANANGFYRKIVQYWLERSPKLVQTEMVAQYTAEAESAFKKAESRRKKAERELKENKLVAFTENQKALQDEHSGLSRQIMALRVANNLIQQPTEIVETEHVSAQTEQLETNARSVAQADEEIVFMVQVAASRTELGIDALQAIYNLHAGEIFFSQIEDEWYKYSVGRFATYEEANAYKQAMNVRGAFVIAYRNDRKISLPELGISPAAFAGSSGEITFRIQIAATRQPASPEKVREMNLGDYIVNITQADGWYKYTLGNFSDKATAEAELAKLHITNAFVVSYDLAGQEVPMKP